MKRLHSILAFCIGVSFLITPATESIAAANTAPKQPTAGEIAAHEQLAADLQAANEKLYEDVLAANQKLAQEIANANGAGLEMPVQNLEAESQDPVIPTAAPTLLPPQATAVTEADKTQTDQKAARPDQEQNQTEDQEKILGESESIPKGEGEQKAGELHPYTFAAMTGFSIPWDGKPLTKGKGTTFGPSGKEVYYNLNMANVVQQLLDNGYTGYYWVRQDGAKMFGEYVMCAAAYDIHPYGSLVETSLGTAIICDTGSFSGKYPYLLDIATAW